MPFQELKFTVDSALLRELGEKLVETVHLALSELVKNSYDADSTKVEVVFETTSEGKNRISVIDNGVGMNFESVQNYWMRIATTNKKTKNVSDVYGRHLTGAKGIGRFSCRRLGTKLTLITKGTKSAKLRGAQKNIEYTKVEFPWTEFEAGSDVTTISCPGEQKIIKEGEITGTILIIDGATDEWSHRGFGWLKRQLAVLVANRGVERPGFTQDPGFEIMLNAPDFEGGVRDLRDDLLNSGWGTLKAHINTKGHAVCELNALGLGRRSIVSNKPFPALVDIKMELGIMVYSSDQIRDKSVLSQKVLTEIIPSWGGVQVKFRGFRVAPYGDDDWLNIDKDRGRRLASPTEELLAFSESLQGVDASRSLLNMLGMGQYIGSVEIGSKSKGFEMKASREGFVESEEMNQLRQFARFAIDWSTILRDYYLRQESQKIAIRAKEEFETVLNNKVESNRVVESALEYIDREIRTVARNLPSLERREVEQSLTKATEAIRRHNESNKTELSHLRLIASTSTLLLIFSHEVKSLLALLEHSKNSLKGIAKTLSGNNKIKVLDVADSFQELNIRLEELLQMTSLIGTDKSRSKPGRIALKPKLEKVEKVFALITNKYNISIDYSQVPDNVLIKRYLEAEVYSVLLNVLSNSIKAVIAGGKRKEIQISSKFEGDKIKILIRDSGIGLNPDRFKEVFTPFVSDPDGKLYVNLEDKLNPEDNMIVGTGSGIGLGIVREIIKAHEGQIKFIAPTNGWSTELEIELE